MLFSGKTSLLNGILAELEQPAGVVELASGAIAYVPQSAWIVAGSIRENVLFGRSYDPLRYNAVLTACQLAPDLEAWRATGGDLTEIGERGLNLSGGQRLRLSLARAAYQATDPSGDCALVLLDDPLSAVDAQVGRALFDSLLGAQGLLRGKTVLMATHQLHT
eukprot:SAG22_NODE_8698_length_636_cov_0.864060_2_plen_162_part_01